MGAEDYSIFSFASVFIVHGRPGQPDQSKCFGIFRQIAGFPTIDVSDLMSAPARRAFQAALDFSKQEYVSRWLPPLWGLLRLVVTDGSRALNSGWQWLPGSLLGGLREGRRFVRGSCWRGLASLGLRGRLALRGGGRGHRHTGSRKSLVVCPPAMLAPSRYNRADRRARRPCLFASRSCFEGLDLGRGV